MSYDFDSQFWLPLYEITRPGNFFCNNSIVSHPVWSIVPSCWNHMSFRLIPTNLGHENSVIILWYTVYCQCIADYIFEEVRSITLPAQNAHQTVAYDKCIGFSSIFRIVIKCRTKYSRILFVQNPIVLYVYVPIQLKERSIAKKDFLRKMVVHFLILQYLIE